MSNHTVKNESDMFTFYSNHSNRKAFIRIALSTNFIHLSLNRGQLMCTYAVIAYLKRSCVDGKE